ncbi:MAG: riboflavin kinase [Myxococcales bacterium]|nr:riboflavin kinase [Myxococcales bacterium]
MEHRGVVVEGQRLGRQLGAPTANIALIGDGGLERGVFAARVDGPGLSHAAARAYVGSRPTVDGSRTVLEVHVLDWSGDLYGAELTVCLGEKVRDEATLPSLEALRERIAENLARVRAHFAGPGA